MNVLKEFLKSFCGVKEPFIVSLVYQHLIGTLKIVVYDEAEKKKYIIEIKITKKVLKDEEDSNT